MICSYTDSHILVLRELMKVVPCLFFVFFRYVRITSTKGIDCFTSHRVIFVLRELDQVVPCLFFVFFRYVRITSTQRISGTLSYILVIVLREPVKVVPCLFFVSFRDVGITSTKGISGVPSHRFIFVLHEPKPKQLDSTLGFNCFPFVLREPVKVVPCLFFVFFRDVGITSTQRINSVPSHRLVIVLYEPCLLYT